jgi:phosphate ABC transporter, phosphate-binding protein
VKRFILAVLAIAVACSPDQSKNGSNAAPPTNQRSGSVDLTGAGATFPYPLYSKWFSDYAANTGVKINYQSIGSGGGIRQFSEQTVDFGATDGPMSDEELSRAKGGAVLHVPTALGGVVITYNLPDVGQPLKLTGPLVSNIFLGTVKKWNDPAIAGLNPGVTLPNQDILVVHRSDGSGTTYVFTDYLTAVSPDWSKGPKKGKEVPWPIGLGGKGNEGVAGLVKQTSGAIGYVELAYAKENGLPAAMIKNAAGSFIAPSTETITAAASGIADKLPPNTDYRISIVNGPGANTYPISSFTWILAYVNQRDSVKGKKLVDFLRWALTDGEKGASALNYAPLPASMTAQLRSRLDSIKLGAAR